MPETPGQVAHGTRLRFVVVCVPCQSPLVGLTACQDTDGLWLMLRCSRCHQTQLAGPLALEDPEHV